MKRQRIIPKSSASADLLPPKSVVMFPFRLKKRFITSRNAAPEHSWKRTTNFGRPNSLHKPTQNYSTPVTRVTFSDKQGSDWNTEPPGSTCTYHEFTVLLKIVIHKQQKRIAKENSVWEIPEFFLRVDPVRFTNSTSQRSPHEFCSQEVNREEPLL